MKWKEHKCAVDLLVRRFSKFSGWNLQWELTSSFQIRVWDNRDIGKSQLVVSLMPGGEDLREVYGRLAHWAVTDQEAAVLVAALKYFLGDPSNSLWHLRLDDPGCLG